MARLFNTSPLEIIDVPADRYHQAVPVLPRDIRFIYLHSTGAPSGQTSIVWLTTSSRPPVSAHRLISRAGTIYKLVRDEHIAFTQGNGRLGDRSPAYRNLNIDGLSIELENENRRHPPFEDYPAAQLHACAMQVVEWWSMYGFLALLYHCDVDAQKHDPSGFPRERFDGMLATELARYL